MAGDPDIALMMETTIPHGPHIHPRDWCHREECLGHTWPEAIDRKQSYGYKIFNPEFLTRFVTEPEPSAPVVSEPVVGSRRGVFVQRWDIP